MTQKYKLERLLIIVAALIIGLLIGLWLRDSFASPEAPVTTRAAEDVENKVPHHPFSLAGLRGGSYPGSTINDEGVVRQTPGAIMYKVSYFSDGLKIYGNLSVPNLPKPSRGYPVIILTHGFVPGPAYLLSQPALQNVADEYLARGYATFTPAYRGHAGSWGAQESAYYSPGYVHDVLNAAASLKSDPRFNQNKIGIMGHSLGGVTALRAAMAEPGTFRAVAIGGASTGTPAEIYANPPISEVSDFVDHFDRKSLIEVYGEPRDDSQFWRSTAIIFNLSLLQDYLYVAHCEDDGVVPVNYSRRLVASARGLGKDVEYHECASGGHGFADDAQQLLTTKTADFFDQHIRFAP